MVVIHGDVGASGRGSKVRSEPAARRDELRGGAPLDPLSIEHLLAHVRRLELLSELRSPRLLGSQQSVVSSQ